MSVDSGSHAVPAVHPERLARDETSTLRGEESDRFRDVRRPPEPTQRDVAPGDVESLLVELAGVDEPGGDAVREHAGGDNEIGIDNICWESDYPHSDSMWPNAPEELHQVLTANSVPDDEINQMTHENAMRWYSFDPFAHVPREQATVGALRRRAAGHDVSVQPRSHQIVAPAQKLAAVRKKAEAATAAAARG